MFEKIKDLMSGAGSALGVEIPTDFAAVSEAVDADHRSVERHRCVGGATRPEPVNSSASRRRKSSRYGGIAEAMMSDTSRSIDSRRSINRNTKEVIMTSRILILSTIVVGSLLVLTVPTTASAVVPSVMSRSTCTQGTNAMLTLSHDDGHVEAEIELHADRAGHIWKVRFYNETVKELTVMQRMNSEDGGGTLSVSRLVTNHAGTDRITVTATNQATRERCVVRATL